MYADVIVNLQLQIYNSVSELQIQFFETQAQRTQTLTESETSKESVRKNLMKERYVKNCMNIKLNFVYTCYGYS